MSRRAINVRARGHGFERSIASDLREHLPEYADQIHRGQQGDGARESDVAGVPGWWIECGSGSTIKPERKWEQALRDTRDLPSPRPRVCVVYRKLRGRPRALLYGVLHGRLEIVDVPWLLAAAAIARNVRGED